MRTGRVNWNFLQILAAAKLNDLEIEVSEGYAHRVTNRTPEFLAKFPLGKVPTFEGSDGLCIAESDAIAQYVAQSGPFYHQLLGHPDDPAEAANIRQWVCFAEGEVMVHVLSLVMWRVGMVPFEEKKEAAGISSIEHALGVLEKHLGGRQWIVGQKLTLADLTLASSLLWAFMHVIDRAMRERFPVVVEWYLRTIGAERVKDIFGVPALIETRLRGPA